MLRKCLKNKYLPVVLTAATFTLTGCGGYYEVTDPMTGQLYLSRNSQIVSGTGEMVMRDAFRDIEVRLPEYEVKTLTREQYDALTRSLPH